jgi:hypothetical protein
MKFLNLSALLLTTVLSLPLPIIEDIHETSVNVATNEPEYTEANRFTVEVTRVDELIETDDNSQKAIRATVVILEFDVNQDGEVVLNHCPIQMGISNIQIDAATVISTAEGFTLEQAEADLDIGLIEVEVYANAAIASKDGVQFRRIELIERITSINGNVVEQAILMQQFLDVLPDGTIMKTQPTDYDSSDFEELKKLPLFPPFLFIPLFIFQAMNIFLSCFVWKNSDDDFEDDLLVLGPVVLPVAYKKVAALEFEEDLPNYDEKEVKV